MPTRRLRDFGPTAWCEPHQQIPDNAASRPFFRLNKEMCP